MSATPPVPPSSSRQFAIVALGVAGIVILMLAVYALMRPHYVVMFRDLKAQDAATIVAELDREKIPYRLADGGQTILVSEKDVQSTRLHVMSSDLPLKGTVGFELFNNSDLGFTEFAQKVNYQRALQGELARTIMSLEGVESARVHLTIPESSLFNRELNKPKASVTLNVRDDQALSVQSTRGIQRLVASAVPLMEPGDVTVLDQHGAAALRQGTSNPDLSDDPQLQLKMDLEAYYSRKLVAALEPVVGRNRVQVSVDAAVNFDQVRITEESNDARSTNSSRSDDKRSDDRSKQETVTSNMSPDVESETQLTGGKSTLSTASPGADRQHNARRLEQIVAAPGSIRRLTVGLLLQTPLDAATQSRISELAAATIGAVASRGDVVSVFVQAHPLETGSVSGDPHAASAPTSLIASSLSSSIANPPERAEGAPSSAVSPAPSTLLYQVIAALAVMVALVCAGFAIWASQRRRQPLTALERAAYVQRIKRLLAEEEQGAARAA